MKPARILSRLVGTIILLSASGKVLAAKPKVDTFALGNGIQVISLYIADSKNVSIISFLPMGLASDGPGQAQWSHLVEHMVLRTPVPLPHNQVNGETMSGSMHLDFCGTVDNWQEGLSLHAKWLKGIPFTQETLEAEKPRANFECDRVARRLFGHKFAIAAWAQGYRHGRKHAALKADINKASLEEIQQYRDSRLAVLDKVVICVVGGIDAKTLKPVITEKLGKITNNAKTPEPVKIHPGDQEMTWDLDARHLVLTWPIPNVTHKDYPSLMVAGQWLTMKCFADPELKNLTGMVLSGSDLSTPEGDFFYISASLKPNASFDKVRNRIAHHLQALRSQSAPPMEITMIAKQLSYQLTNLRDPAIAKAQAPAHVTEAMIEGNLAIQWAIHDFRYGSNRAILAKRLAAVSPEQVSQAAQAYLSNDKCSACSLSFGQ